MPFPGAPAHLLRLATLRQNGRLTWDDNSKHRMKSCRAFRLCSPSRFLVVSVDKNVRDHVFSRNLRSWVAQGIKLGDTKYAFLGCTDDQVLEADTKIMFLQEGDFPGETIPTVESLLESFGNLKLVYQNWGYGKYIARLHMSFSGTVASLDVEDQMVAHIKDIKADNGTLHTDGIGMIRMSFAQEIYDYHEISDPPSPLQIRRGGIKGVLCPWPDEVFDTLVGRSDSGKPYKIAVRDSMKKYLGGPTVLEIVKACAAPQWSAKLNQQLILLLLTAGVPFKVFEKLLSTDIDFVKTILTDREKAIKCTTPFAWEWDPGDDSSGSWGKRILSMLEANQNMKEPYLVTELSKFQKWRLDTLHKKLCMRVPKSCYIMGVIDELGVLEADEIFLKLPHRHGDIQDQKVVVTRMPCFSPGDLRIFTVVDRPGLGHLENCIVFSQKSSWSIPDMIASGDLDGDLYLVIWDQDLIPPRQAPPVQRSLSLQTGPSHATASTPQRIDEACVSTIMKYRRGSLQVGLLHKSWIHAAQETPALAGYELATSLATLNESVLDMIKTGIDMTQLKNQRVSLVKEHSAGSSGDAFQSPIDILKEQVQTALNNVHGKHPKKPWTPDPSLVLKDEDPQTWAELLEEAKSTMPAFNSEIFRAIRTGRHTDIITYNYTKKYYDNESEDLRKRRMRASAWYYYGYQHGSVLFPWLGITFLNSIRRDRTEVSEGST